MIDIGRKIIAFEGLDNSFKETNCKGFINWLRAAEVETKIVFESFPRYGNTACIAVEKWLSGAVDRSILKQIPSAVCSLYSMDRMFYWYESVHGQTKNIDLLDDYHTFIFDRYCFSNAIYNPLNGKFAIEEDIYFDAKQYAIPMADIVVFFRCNNLNIYLENLKTKANKDANELDVEFMTNVWEKAETAIKVARREYPKFIVIDILSSSGRFKNKFELLGETVTSILDIPDSGYNHYAKLLKF